MYMFFVVLLAYINSVISTRNAQKCPAFNICRQMLRVCFWSYNQQILQNAESKDKAEMRSEG